MKKEEFIERYGEEAWEKQLERRRAWYKAHPEKQKAYTRAWQIDHPEQVRALSKKWREEHLEESKALAKAWRDAHPEQVKENHNQGNRKGGKYYEKVIAAQRIGLQGEKNKIRKRHRKEYQPFKDIIAPDSQLHHEWIPLSYDYRGLALVEAKPHQYGIIDVILILDGTITLLTEEDVKNGKKKQSNTV